MQPPLPLSHTQKIQMPNNNYKNEKQRSEIARFLAEKLEAEQADLQTWNLKVEIAGLSGTP